MLTINSKDLPNKKLRLLLTLFSSSPIVFIFIILFKKLLFPNLVNCQFFPGFMSYCGNIYASNCHLSNTKFIDYAKITIGSGTNFGWDCIVLTAKHDKDDFSNIHLSNVVIGKNCFIGPRVIIMPGVIIGDNVTIGGSSVITKNIPSNSFVHGIAAKIINNDN